MSTLSEALLSASVASEAGQSLGAPDDHEPREGSTPTTQSNSPNHQKHHHHHHSLAKSHSQQQQLANSNSKQQATNSNLTTTPSQAPTTPNQTNMHVCRLCDKLLSSSSSLDRHMLTHSGERPFVCKRCHMTFTTNGE